MEFEAILAEEIKKLRQNAGHSQAKLGDMVGLDANYISKLERNERTPGIATLFKISHACNSTLSALIMRVEERSKIG